MQHNRVASIKNDGLQHDLQSLQDLQDLQNLQRAGITNNEMGGRDVRGGYPARTAAPSRGRDDCSRDGTGSNRVQQ